MELWTSVRRLPRASCTNDSMAYRQPYTVSATIAHVPGDTLSVWLTVVLPRSSSDAEIARTVHEASWFARCCTSADGGFGASSAM